MRKRLQNLCLSAMMFAASTAAWALSEVGGVYQIASAEDLKAFAELVNGSDPYAKAVLTANIDKGLDATMIGRDGQDFQGIFDGQGYTITVNTFNDESKGTALFRNVGPHAVIKNLKVQGNITTNQQHAAGIAVWSAGVIQGCYVDLTVTSSFAGDATHAGIVAEAYQGTVIEDCLAKFVIKGATTQNCGGIIGWTNVESTIMNCLVISDGSDFDIKNGGSNNIARNDGNIVVIDLEKYNEDSYANYYKGANYNNYVTNQWGTNKATTVVPYDQLADGRICYQLNNDQSHIGWKQTIGVDPFPVPAAFGTDQVYASDVTGCDGKSENELTFSNEGTVQATPHSYDKFGVCTVCGTYNTKCLEFDESDHTFLLKSAADIDLAEGRNRMQNGAQFNLKMVNDIKYTAEPTRYIFNTSNWYDGNFNGNGHTLTIEMSEMGNEASLFPNFSGTFENVIMHGSISTNAQYAASITSRTRRDRVKILNVFSDIEINSTTVGDNTTAGLIGVAETRTSVENAIYAGNINGIEGSECLAGLCGWAAGQTRYTNCAFLGTINNGSGDSKTISRNQNNIVCENVYSLTDYGYGDSEKFNLYENYEGVENGELAFFLNSKQEGLDRFYQKIGVDLFPMPIKQEGALVYSAASDYRCDGMPLGETIYTNTPSGSTVIPPHEFEEGFCTVCGSLQEDYLTPVDGWYEISNGAELLWWNHYASKNLHVNARLTDNIDMDGYSDRWTAVGTEGKPFYGNFDGQYHIISNLIVDMPETNGVGLIAVMNSLPSKGYGGLSDEEARNAEGVFIKNVVLDETCSLRGHGYVALVGMTAGWAGHVNISGVMMCGDVSANGGPNAAGVFGCVMGSACRVTIDRCGMVGNVYGEKENGSFSGWLGDWAEVTNCFAVGSVEGIENNDRYFARYGNDRVKQAMTNCYARYGTQVPTVSEEDFESGALAWRANGSQFRTPYWYQTIGEDLYPYPDPSHGTVIYAAEQYFSIVDEADIDEVSGAIQTHEEEAHADVIATQSVLDDFMESVAALADATTILEFADAIDSVNAKKDSVAVNASVYKAYIEKCEEIKARLESDDSFNGEIREALEYYLAETDEPTEENPLGTYNYIVDVHTATAAEIKKETDRVAEWLAKAIAEDYAPGTDISGMILNGDFSEGANEKWTDGFATGTGTLKSEDPAINKIVGVEAWDVTGDMYQTIEGLKPGYYLVGTHAAFRPSNNRYSTNYAAGIYANGTFNYFPTVVEDYVAADDTLDQVNCNLHGDGALDLAIYDDNESTDQATAESLGSTLLGYAVHGPGGMAAAANDDRYKVYTLAKVTEDGMLTIGIKNPGTKYGSDWTGWSAISLKYLGEDAETADEGISMVVDNMTLRAQTIMDYMYDEMTYEAAPNFPEELRTELAALAEGGSGLSAEDVVAGFSDVFQKIYDGKQAYIKLGAAGNYLANLEGANLPLVEKDLETGEWFETGEWLFSEDETSNMYKVSSAMLDGYLLGSYSAEEALAAAEMNDPLLEGIVAPRDEEGYFLLSTPKHLAFFRAVAGFCDYTVKAKLTADIDMTGIAMLPINRADYSFRGVFDGQRFAINNVYMNLPEERCSFFNTTDGATIKNLKLTGEYFSDQKFMGGLTGYAYNTKFQNCEVAVTLNSTIEGDGTHGGLLGNNAGDGTVVENCIVNTNILGEETDCCGGVCGWAGSKIEIKNTLVLSSYTVGANGSNPVSRGDNATVNNVFYLNNFGTAAGNVTKEMLASGEVAYKMNGSKSEGELAWFQTIGVDSIPCLFEGDVVYFYGGQYMNEKPNPQLNAFAYDVQANLKGSNVVVEFKLNAEAEAAAVKFYDGETLVYTESVSELAAGANSVSVAAANLGSEPTALSYEVEVKGKGSLDFLKVGESIKFNSPYGLATNNNPASKGFGQVLVTESRPTEDPEGMFSTGTPGALFAFDAMLDSVGAYYGGLDVLTKTPLMVSGDNNMFDLKDLRFSKDGRLFVGRASGTSNSSVYEINPDNLEEAWKPVFTGGELDEATGITYVGDEEQNRMAVGLAFNGEGEDLQMYVLGAQRSNGENNTTDYTCSVYNLGTATEWAAAPSATYEPLNGVYVNTPSHVGIHEDGMGGLWFIQYSSKPSAELPSIKHFDAEGNEDYSDVTTSTHSGKLAVTTDGKYLAIPMGSGKLVIYETNYVPMANGKIYLNPVYNISLTESQITGLAFDYANNLYVASSGSKTLSRYVIPSWNNNTVVTPGNAIGVATANGDINGDGSIDIADAVSVLNIMAAGGADTTADVNNDGSVDIADFVTILNMMAAQ